MIGWQIQNRSLVLLEILPGLPVESLILSQGMHSLKFQMCKYNSKLYSFFPLFKNLFIGVITHIQKAIDI